MSSEASTHEEAQPQLASSTDTERAEQPEPEPEATMGAAEDDTQAKAAADEENKVLREALAEKDREIFLLKEELYANIMKKKQALAQQRAVPVDIGSQIVTPTRFPRQPTGGSDSAARRFPRLSPRSRRMVKTHMAGEQYAGNYGQRLYEFGMKEFDSKRQGKMQQLASAMETKRMEGVTFLPSINKHTPRGKTEDSGVFWERLYATGN